MHRAELRNEVYFVSSVPEPVEWLTPESWSATGDVYELRQAFDGFHADVRGMLEACPACHKWADDDISRAFVRYEQHRKPRTSRIQAVSRANTWLRTQGGDYA